ncbi:hypothetical protein [Flavobacterium agrisoli]|uniref:Lipoprotein n=1 Tax=Flavobacterium agrisoli TaxID=2793066 RepID=A0A934PP87_9FLAO|nr:hypothetical protein [Flavobacterium agrisoli]MBK0370583.1 hypothetical protein [Flavobacterium agrisoli]
MKPKQKHTKFLLPYFMVAISIFMVSCSKDSYETVTDVNNSAYDKVKTDPLFIALDKARHDSEIIALTYSGTDVVAADAEEQTKKAILSRKIKSQEEIAKFKEALGYRDYEKRSKVRLDYAYASLAFYKKYPEYKNNDEFKMYMIKNSKYKLSMDTIKKMLNQNKIYRKENGIAAIASFYTK